MLRIVSLPVDRVEAWKFDVGVRVKYLSRYDGFMNLMLSHNNYKYPYHSNTL